MELLSPSQPPPPIASFYSGFSAPVTFRRVTDHTARHQLPETAEDGAGIVHVAVGKSVEKSVALLKWVFGSFEKREVCILHVHQPSPFIPTLLGRLPASRANAEVVSAFRNTEREETRKLLHAYLSICCKSKVKASIITTEADQVQKGIIDLINKHGIKKLIIGATPDCMKVKKSSRKASYTAKNAPSFCEIWFVNKGRLVWTRQAPGKSSSVASTTLPDPASTDNLRSQSLQSFGSEVISQSKCLRSNSDISELSSGSRNRIHCNGVHVCEPSESIVGSPTDRFHLNLVQNYSSQTSFSSSSGYNVTAEERESTDSGTRFEEESLYEQLAQVKIEAEALKNTAVTEYLKCIKLEGEAAEAIGKVKAFESAYEREAKFRKEAEDALRTTIQEQEKVLEEREEITQELHKTMRNIAVLDTRAQEANRRCQEVAGELKLIQASIATLSQEKQKLQRQKLEAMQWLDYWKTHGKEANISYFTGNSSELVEFTLPELQTATCNFSESFRIGRGAYGSVYKGELLDRTVAIKKMHPHDIQGQPGFHKEAQIIGKLHHPHLVTLIGICPEAWSLVYEYLPSGNLQDRLFSRSNVPPLNWKIRTRIIGEIASGLIFLHSFKYEVVVHGDLKPENILLDSENSCKISDVGISRLGSEQTLRCPSFRHYSEPKGAFPYTDPEFYRTGILTSKSDIYSFGVIILQLLTGKNPAGLASEVRRAVTYRRLESILDLSAGEWSTFVAKRLVDLALQFCELYSRDRPELTPSLVKELQNLHMLEEQPVPSFFLCPILQEIMHDPQVAADGFTYEGEALRGWLDAGRDTSPMTNLKLSHLDLTPNHALRLAIQEWLCKSWNY